MTQEPRHIKPKTGFSVPWLLCLRFYRLVLPSVKKNPFTAFLFPDIVNPVEINKEVDSLSVKIRLTRMGSKRKPFYRLVVADSRSPRDGRFIEEVGYYNPLTEPKTLKVDEEKIMGWLQNGAQPSDTVRNLLSTQGIMKKYHEARFAKK